VGSVTCMHVGTQATIPSVHTIRTTTRAELYFDLQNGTTAATHHIRWLAFEEAPFGTATVLSESASPSLLATMPVMPLPPAVVAPLAFSAALALLHCAFLDRNVRPDGTIVARNAELSLRPPTTVMAPVGATRYRKLPTVTKAPRPDAASAAAAVTPEPPNRLADWDWYVAIGLQYKCGVDGR
jgi:hypothetical protein